MEFTGRENVYMNAAILGLTTEEIDRRYQEILDFADIGDFINQPVKTYSSGMQIRLAFAVQVLVQPDILIVDEALAVGDIFFQQKCLRKIGQMVEAGATVLLVTHDMGTLVGFCSRAIYLKGGSVAAIGPAPEIAEKYQRKVVFTGRSMLNVSQIAMKLGVLHYDRENVINIEDVKKYADNEICILTTGSQGEQLSALTRMANDNFAKFKLTTNDCVVFSSSPIPGNEKSIINVMNKLVHKGVGLVYDKLAPIHASGHGYQDEISTILSIVRPEYVLPVHGEYMHLEDFRKFAKKKGFQDRNIIIADLGNQVIMSNNLVRKAGFVKVGAKLIDGNTFGDANSPVIKDRLQLAQDGFVIAIVNISSKLGKLLSEPIIITRGLLYNHEMETVLKELKTAVSVHLKSFDLHTIDATELKNNLKKFISNTVARKTKRKPIVLCTTIIN